MHLLLKKWKKHIFEWIFNQNKMKIEMVIIAFFNINIIHQK
jgi:hypothetical protein